MSEKSFEQYELEYAVRSILRMNPGIHTDVAFRKTLLTTLEKEFFYSKEKLEWSERMLDAGEVDLPSFR